MACFVPNITKKALLYFFSISCIIFSGGESWAQVTAPGCSQAVMNAMNARAQAEMAYDIAVTNQMLAKPDSVLAMTCFSNAAGVSAANGGAIFSGDFTSQLNTVVTTAAPPYNCTYMQNLWNNTISTIGINTAVPYATFADLMSGTPPAGAGANYTANWNAAGTSGIFTGLATAVNALPVPTAQNFSGATSACLVLRTAGVYLGACPPPP